MSKKKKSLTDKIKDALTSKEDVIEEKELTEEEVASMTEEDFLANEETLAELSNGKGEDDELPEPLAEVEGE